MMGWCVAWGVLGWGTATAWATPGSPPGEDGRRADDLSKKLIHQATTGEDLDIMAQITTGMSAAGEQLVRELDAGLDTQAVQEQIVLQLEEAIEAALQQRAPARARQRSESERRELGERRDDPSDDETAETGEQPEDPSEVEEAGDADEAERRRGPFREWRRGWGHLPQRDREELLQGIGEDSLERYREQIEQYYRALTEPSEGS
ncbi:MAG: hypothetical protein GY842_14720 [bacterium]|nr:hypothetical protein [bacterium]